MNRRDFLKHSLATSTIAALPAVALPPATGPIRHAINGLAATDPIVAKYAKAVAAMRALPASDPRNWTNQASIHNNHCPHDNWWFLPWHRAYLYYFEAVCRDVLQDPTFALPYWNWSKSNTIPAPFLDTHSPLFDSTRAAATIPASVVAQSTITHLVSSGALVDLFSDATTTDSQRSHVSAGALESGPHNGVHATILGDMGNFMSPLDPIFWLHHCNLDRIWASWSKKAGHNPPTSALWNNHALTEFYDPATKTKATPKVSDLTAAKWHATYDKYESSTPRRTLTPPLQTFFPAFSEQLDTAPATPGKRKLKHSASVADLSSGVSVGSAQRFAVARPAELANFALRQRAISLQATQSYLVIEEVPAPKTPSTSLRVFLNAANPTASTPITDPSYLGTISFFGTGHHGANASTFSLNVTDVLATALGAAGAKPTDPLQVGLVAVDLINPARVSPDEVVRPARLRIVSVGPE